MQEEMHKQTSWSSRTAAPTPENLPVVTHFFLNSWTTLINSGNAEVLIDVYEAKHQQHTQQYMERHARPDDQ